MANNLTILNKKTIMQKVIAYSGVASAALVLTAGYQGCERAVEQARVKAAYESRVANVEGQIRVNNLAEAQRVLTVYAKDNDLSTEDQKRLDLQIKAKLTANEQAEKDKAKALKLKPLDELISQKKHDEAEGLYAKLTSEGVLAPTSPEYGVYSNKIAGISLEAQLEKMQTERNSIHTKTGLERISAIDAFCNTYTNNVVTEDLRLMQGQTYARVMEDYFIAKEEPSKVSSLLDNFLDWSKKQDSVLIINLNVKENLKGIVAKGKEYLATIPRDEDREIHIGDKVRVTKKLGIAHGNPNEYYVPSDVPMKSEGIVTGIDIGTRNEAVSKDTVRVWIKDQDHIFASRELTKLGDEYSPKILAKLNEIERIYGGTK